MITITLIAVVVLAGSVGDIFLSRGMKQVGEINSLHWRFLLQISQRALTNLSLIGGIGGMAVAFFSWLAVLSFADLSFAEPATAVSYVLNTLGAKFFLHERIDRMRWAGTLLVCLGAALLSLDPGVK